MAAASGDDVVDVMLEVDATTYLPGDLIPKIDIATMAHALEARSPLLDHELMEFAASIPAEYEGARAPEEVDPARGAARLAARPTILDRPKQGFASRSATGSATSCASTVATCCWTPGRWPGLLQA